MEALLTLDQVECLDTSWCWRSEELVEEALTLLVSEGIPEK
jgi:hypothetical protein